VALMMSAEVPVIANTVVCERDEKTSDGAFCWEVSHNIEVTTGVEVIAGVTDITTFLMEAPKLSGSVLANEDGNCDSVRAVI